MCIYIHCICILRSWLPHWLILQFHDGNGPAVQMAPQAHAGCPAERRPASFLEVVFFNLGELLVELRQLMSDAVLRVVKCWSGWRSDCSNTFWRKCTTITKIYIYIICSMFNCSKVGKYQDLSTFPCWSRPVWWNCSVDGREKFWSPPISFWKDPFCPQPQLHRAWNWFWSSTIGTLRPFSITSGIQFHRPQLCLVVELAQDGQCLLGMTDFFWLIRFERLVMRCNESDCKSKSILGIN